MVFLSLALTDRAPAVTKSIAFAFHLDDFGMVEKTVDNGRGRRDIVEQLASFFDGPVGGHERGAVLIAAHDDFQENLPGFGRQDFESHVIDD